MPGRVELPGSDFFNSQRLIPVSLAPLCSIEWLRDGISKDIIVLTRMQVFEKSQEFDHGGK
jgi:hypothetical protein